MLLLLLMINNFVQLIIIDCGFFFIITYHLNCFFQNIIFFQLLKLITIFFILIINILSFRLVVFICLVILSLKLITLGTNLCLFFYSLVLMLFNRPRLFFLIRSKIIKERFNTFIFFMYIFFILSEISWNKYSYHLLSLRTVLYEPSFNNSTKLFLYILFYSFITCRYMSPTYSRLFFYIVLALDFGDSTRLFIKNLIDVTFFKVFILYERRLWIISKWYCYLRQLFNYNNRETIKQCLAG